MPKKTKLIEFTAKRRPDGSVGGPLTISFEANATEKIEAFNALVGATLKVAELWRLDAKLLAVAEQLVKNAAPKVKQ